MPHELPEPPCTPSVITRDKVIALEALEAGDNGSRQISAPGQSAVDFEQRADFRRLPAADALDDHAVPSVERIVDTVVRTSG